jgi:hypothetical protein
MALPYRTFAAFNGATLCRDCKAAVGTDGIQLITNCQERVSETQICR